MKFQLFGRFKDDEENNTTNQDTGQFQQEMGQGGQEETNFGSAIERTIENMFDQGYSEEEIKTELQGQYSKQEISQAINRVVRDSATSTGPQGGPEPMTPYREEEEQDEAISPMEQGFDGNGNEGEPMPNNNQPPQENDRIQQNPAAPQQEEMIPQNPSQEGPSNQPKQAAAVESSSEVEELIETIIAEKFKLVEEEFESVYGELDTFAEEIEELKQRVHDLEVRDDEDQRQFIQKVDEVEEHIDRYDSRIGGLEKAFQQVLPNLVDNVRDLTGLVQDLKEEKGVETDTNVSEKDIEDLDWE